MAEAKSDLDVTRRMRRERQLRKQLSALLAEPETQLIMRADHVNTDDLLGLLIKTAEELHSKAPTHSKRKSHLKSGSLLSLFQALRRLLNETDS